MRVRLILTLACAIFAVTVAAWIWSSWRRGCINYATSSSSGGVVVDKGALWFIHSRVGWQPDPGIYFYAEDVWPVPFVSGKPQFLGFYAWRGTDSLNLVSDQIGVGIPLWFPALLSAGIVAHGFRQIVRRRRASRGLTMCKSCGYDLRAGHDKCPECGGESHVKVGASESTNTPSAPAVQR